MQNLVVMSLILIEKHPSHVIKLTLNAPDSLNAMSEQMAKDFSEAVESLRSSAATARAIILTGAGRAFSAGGDLEMLQKKQTIPHDENKKIMIQFYNSFLGIRNLGIPIIAAINGAAVGAGLCVACGCDIRIGSTSSKFGFTFTRLGLHPGMGGTYFVPQVVGYAAASELMLTGRMINAEEALRLGLISQIVPDGEAVQAAEKIADEISLCGPEATRQLLESLRNGSASLDIALKRESECQAINYASKEFAEGVVAVKEKRKAQW